MNATSPPPLGMIAGSGRLPLLVLQGAQAAGRKVAVVGLRGWADPTLQQQADLFRWSGVARLGGWIRALRRAGCAEAIMVGQVRKSDMFAMPRWRQWLLYWPDLTSIRVWYYGTRDKRNHTLLRAVADELERQGVPLIDSTTYIAENLADEGVLMEGPALQQVLDDAEFGWPILKQIAALDIGQAIAVKEREVIAVEAIEGTDGLIARTGPLCPAGGWTLLKAASAQQDMRFDVPTIGPDTIAHLKASNARGLVVEAGKTIILERDKTLALARRAGICIVGRARDIANP